MKTEKSTLNATNAMELRSAFSPTSRASDIHFDVENEPSLTQQNMLVECDINNIMKKYAITGEITHVNSITGQFGDFSDIRDYQTSLNIVIAADEAFMALPAYLRERFENDPAKFLDFVHDDKNRDEAIELGLIPNPKGADAPSAPSGSHIAGDGAAGGSTPPNEIAALRAEIQALRGDK
nr:MAG: internal scaffolding protein [Microvirus sp.]